MKGPSAGCRDPRRSSLKSRQGSFGQSCSPRRRRLSIELLEDRLLLAVFTVNCFADGKAAGDLIVHLRGAIMATNELPGNDTINLPAGTYTLSLTDPGEEGGDLDVTDTTGSLTVIGEGADVTIVDAGGPGALDDRVLRVHAGATLNLSGVTITGGYAPGQVDIARVASGGGIANSGATVMTDCIVTGNSVPFSLMGARGGGVYNHYGAAMEITRCTISGNSVTHTYASGGGICNNDSATMLIADSIISDNWIDTTFDGRGGGICNYGELDITDSTFSGNHGAGSGGGMFSQSSGNVTLTDTTFCHNSASEGGGMYRRSGGVQVMLANCTFSENSALYDGGAIVNYGLTSGYYDAPITISGSTLLNNTAGETGGAIANGQDGLMTLIDSTISGNSVTGQYAEGGGIYVFTGGDCEIINSTVSSNSATGMYAQGGGIYNFRGETALANCTVTGNLAGQDGGGIHNDEGVLDILNSAVSANSAVRQGGGILNNGEAALANCTISENSATDQYANGGGIYNIGPLEIINSTVFGNSASGSHGEGGGIYSGGATTLATSTVSGNSAALWGGGIRKHTGTLDVVNSTLSGNSAVLGGGIFSGGPSDTVKVGNSIIADNTGTASDPDAYGDLDSQGNNLVGDAGSSRGWLPTDLVGDSTSPFDPMLGPLGANGGPTETYLPLVGSPVIEAGSNTLAHEAGLTCDQRGTDRFMDGDGDGITLVDIGAVEFFSDQPDVVNRRIFYNNSRFDNYNRAANADDDSAVAADKTALRLGWTATFVSYTSYSRGINGIMVDIQYLANPDELNIENLGHYFEFHVGNSDDPTGWGPAPIPSNVGVRESPDNVYAKRVTITWEDYAIRNQWLQVTVLADAEYTGLDEPEVFYFGNAVGESGNSDLDAAVNDTDVLLAQNNPHTFVNPATVTCAYDYNRDERVNATDMLIARSNPTDSETALKLIHPQLAPGESPGAECQVAQPLLPTSSEEAPASPTTEPEAHLAKLAWLCDFDQPGPRTRLSRKAGPAAAAVDKLLATFWP